jgi:hypothetical protein
MVDIIRKFPGAGLPVPTLQWSNLSSSYSFAPQPALQPTAILRRAVELSAQWKQLHSKAEGASAKDNCAGIASYQDTLRRSYEGARFHPLDVDPPGEIVRGLG